MIKYTTYFTKKDLQKGAVNLSQCCSTYYEMGFSSKVALFAGSEAPSVFIQNQKNRVLNQQSKHEFHHYQPTKTIKNDTFKST